MTAPKGIIYDIYKQRTKQKQEKILQKLQKESIRDNQPEN